MRKNTILASLVSLIFAAPAVPQQSDILIKLRQGERAALAVTDFRGTGGASQHMDSFNQTLFRELQDSGLFRMVPKSVFPLEAPQHPRDFRPPLPPATQPKRGTPAAPVRQGPWLTDWSQAPVNANYLAFGYAAVQEDRLVIFGWFYNVNQQDLANAQVLGKMYFGSADESGARQTAREFAADILGQFGFKSLMGSRIYFTSDRTGSKEIWSMEPDGSDQKQHTFYRSLSSFVAVSPDHTKIAFTTYAKGNPSIFIHSLETGRQLPFYNQRASMNATPEFTPDGTRLLFSSTAAGAYAQIYICSLDGSGLRRLTSVRAVEVEPKVNPKTGAEVVFVSGRSGPPQIYRMNLDGVDLQRLTPGDGEAVNPSWHPDGRHIAFSWTKGYDPGNYNVFVMDVATREYIQLTHGAGRNENPSWAPDGRHIVFSSSRGGSNQLWTMLADGTQLRQLTTRGRNEKPVWSK